MFWLTFNELDMVLKLEVATNVHWTPKRACPVQNTCFRFRSRGAPWRTDSDPLGPYPLRSVSRTALDCRRKPVWIKAASFDVLITAVCRA